MEQRRQQATVNSDEVSLREITLKLGEWWRFLLGKWLVILILGLIGAGIGLGMAFMNRARYEAELTFVLEDSKGGGGLGAYASLASQFGFDLGGTGNVGVFSGDNILEFLTSRLMIEKTLLCPVIIGGKKMSLADLYIEATGISETWSDKPLLKGLSFPPDKDRNTFSLQQDSILGIIQEKLVEKNLEISKPDKKLSFISVKMTFLNERFAKYFVENLVREATDFYVSTKTKRSKTNVDKLQFTADSLGRLLNVKTYAVAATQDLNLNPARQLAGVKTELETRDKIMLQTMYLEVVKNLEISKMAMAQEAPVVQIIDNPILPLKKRKMGKLQGIIVGGIIAGVLGSLFLLIRKIFNEIALTR
jgi:hypothetical protein